MTNKKLHNQISKFMESNGFETHEKFTAVSENFHFSTFLDHQHLIFVWTKEEDSTIEAEITKDRVCIGKHIFQDLTSFQSFFFNEDLNSK